MKGCLSSCRHNKKGYFFLLYYAFVLARKCIHPFTSFHNLIIHLFQPNSNKKSP